MADEDYSDQLKHFYVDLRSDWKKWAMLQIKQAMINGRNYIVVGKLEKRMYRKAKTILNFWKPIPLHDVPYYDKNTNIVLTDKRSRDIVDYIRSLGLSWFIDVQWDDTILSEAIYNLNITTFYTKDVLNQPRD